MNNFSDTNPSPIHTTDAETKSTPALPSPTDRAIEALNERTGATFRRANRAERRSGRAITVIFGNPDPEPTSGFDTLRKQADIIRLIDERGLPYEIRMPDLIDRCIIEKVHDPRYVQAIIDGEPRHLANSGLGWDPGRYMEVLISTSAVVAAVQHALAKRTNAGCTSSGLHHAKAGMGDGFCTFNGLAIAAIEALQAGAKRVLILDLDAHCGGGTAQLIAGVKGIEQVDVSVSSFDQYVNTPNATRYMARGDNYLEVVDDALAAVIDPESIDVVIYNAGMDPHEHSLGGATGIDAEVLAERERMVFEWANSRGIPVAFTLAGGYTSSELSADELAELHLATFEASHASAPIAR